MFYNSPISCSLFANKMSTESSSFLLFNYKIDFFGDGDVE